MRRFAFVIAVLGMLLLLFMLIFGKVEKVENYEQLEKLEVNQRVSIAGEVKEERAISRGRKILVLENEIELVCECFGKFEGKEIEAEGIVSEFDGKKQVEVLKLNVD